MLHDNKAVRKAAQERMERLYELAYQKNRKGEDEKLARKYIVIARGISSHYKINMPTRIKNAICKKCSTTLIPGRNCSVRLVSTGGYLLYACSCGHRNRVFYGKKK
jgi:ribonuclease P protein subunit RPR2